MVVDRIGDIYRSLPRRADVIVTTVGARHKCQQGVAGNGPWIEQAEPLRPWLTRGCVKGLCVVRFIEGVVRVELSMVRLWPRVESKRIMRSSRGRLGSGLVSGRALWSKEVVAPCARPTWLQTSGWLRP
ncbi:2-methylene-furan-3-one reductase-like [Dorcoceras hygrometricum]|uniref:2-methylene-furan-3-one reductase-like n=1 Tax=Dorcoceras hygrometricum TaxID=472368 RepID=A0A2Z7A7B0_9LAMI|nr:2-methylene-furan-3-one reductase-like [Dorcoceras hygrometricum]